MSTTVAYPVLTAVPDEVLAKLKRPFLAKIYKIVCLVNGKMYVGSTKRRYLSSRMAKHRFVSKQYPQRLLYAAANELGWDQFTISLLEEFQRTSHEMMRAREHQWCEHLGTYKREIGYNEIRAYLSEEEGKLYRQAYERMRTDSGHNAEKTKAIIARIQAEKRYYCAICDHAAQSPSKLTTHLATNKHKQKAMASANTQPSQ